MRNPHVHAVLAALYIVCVVLGMNAISTDSPDEASILIPMAALSLLVLSVTVMGYLFIFEPVRMYLEGSKKEGISFFFTSVGTFAVLTALFVLTVLVNR